MDPPSRMGIEDEQVARRIFPNRIVALCCPNIFCILLELNGHAPSWNRSRSTTLDRARAQIDQEACHLITKGRLWSSNTGTVPSLFVSLRSSTHARYAWRISLWLVCFVDPQRRIVLGRVEKFRDQGTGSLYNLQSVGDSRSLGPTGTTRLCRG